MSTRTQIKILRLEQACNDLRKDLEVLKADINCVQFIPAKNVILNMYSVKKEKLERMKVLKNYNISNLSSEDVKIQKEAEEME